MSGVPTLAAPMLSVLGVATTVVVSVPALDVD